MMPEVVQFSYKDIKAVTDLHCRIFPDSRSTKLGRSYVTRMYKWFVSYQSNLCFIAKDSEKIIGYVVGAIGGYGRKIFRYAFLEVLIGLLIHPKLWFQKDTFLLWRSYLKGLFPKKDQMETYNFDQPRIVSAALAGIGVDIDQRGQGVGKILLSKFEQAAIELGVQRMSLSVQSDNRSARSLYDHSGWVIESENIESNSVHYVKQIM